MQQFLINEPYLWLQRCFFQPVKFKEEFETTTISQRLVMLLRLMPLLFLYAYTPALLIRLVLFSLHPDFYPLYGFKVFTPLNADVGWFLFDALWATVLSCLTAGLIGGLFSVRLGIAVALGLGLANGIIVHTVDDNLVGVVFGLAFGLIMGIPFNSANAVKHGGVEKMTVAIVCGVAGGLLIGGFTGIVGGYWAGLVVGLLFPPLQNYTNIWGSTAGLAVGGIAGCILATLLGFVISHLVKSHHAAVMVGVRVGIAVSTAFGLAIAIPVGDAAMSMETFRDCISAGLIEEVIVGVAFLSCYFISYYRLPLYPFSAYSTIQAYLASQSRLFQAIYCLRNSSLHWDECVFLPLPYLKRTLLLAADQTLNEALKEINFIVQERPQQRWAAQAVAYKLALCDLEGRERLYDIGLAHQQLAVFLPAQLRALSSGTGKVFRNLERASHEAASYQSQVNKNDRQDALERMLQALNGIAGNSSFGDSELNRHLQTIVKNWRMLAEQVKETLGSTPGNFYIENPYAPGNPLELHDPLFVGRDDVVQKLGQALQRKYRPTFLLTGERRMGKSSIIRQLPVLLGPRYIPVFYDLQGPNILASISTFFTTVASGIEKQFHERGLFIQKLERSQLDEVLRQSEAAVYDLFDQWLVEVEQLLIDANCVVILAFDEFEKLEEAAQRDQARSPFDLKLLFDFFRSIIQNRSRLALLFSGAKMVGDMGRSWAGYFVNVERIKVSFLRDADARELIQKPVLNVFNDEVTQEIMQVTSCHPFLVQAVCKQIIEQLNDTSRKQAEIEDVSTAIVEVFEVWVGYFWDLWDRCDADQRTCLLALLALKETGLDQLVEKSGLSKQKTQLALEKLQIRDIVTNSHTTIRFAVPIFAQWLQQNQHLLLPAAE
jgi:hypothetical protein